MVRTSRFVWLACLLAAVVAVVIAAGVLLQTRAGQHRSGGSTDRILVGRVAVTDIQATDVDTGVGDVHEATARAVWQAVGIIPQPAHQAGTGEV